MDDFNILIPLEGKVNVNHYLMVFIFTTKESISFLCRRVFFNKVITPSTEYE